MLFSRYEMHRANLRDNLRDRFPRKPLNLVEYSPPNQLNKEKNIIVKRWSSKDGKSRSTVPRVAVWSGWIMERPGGSYMLPIIVWCVALPCCPKTVSVVRGIGSSIWAKPPGQNVENEHDPTPHRPLHRSRTRAGFAGSP